MRVEVGLVSHPFQETSAWPGLGEIGDDARRIEGLGFNGVLVPEAGHDPFLPLAIAAERTERITLRTGIAVAFPRAPMVTAQLAWDLARFSGGRFRLGLGTQVKAHNERRYGAPWTGAPGPRLREYVQALRAMFRSFQDPGAPIETFAGEHYRFELLPPFFNPGPIEHPHVPIAVAAVNPYVTRLAGELADELYPHPICTPRYLAEVLRPLVAEGAARGGRDPGEIGVVASPMFVTGADAAELERNKAFVKQRLGFYAATRSYHPALEVHGRLEWGQHLVQLSREQRWAEMIGCVTDEILDEFAVVAPPDELGPALAERWGGALASIHLDLTPELRDNPKVARAILDALR